MKKALKYILAFLVLSSLSGLLTFIVLNRGRVAEVPDLKGKSVREAEKLIEGLDITLKVSSGEYDPHVPEGRIISQDTPEGSVTKGGEIKVTVSRGALSKPLPKVAGMTIEEAKEALLKEGIEPPKVIYVRSDTGEKDRVIAEGLGEGDGEATLIVSSGPYDVSYYCPDLRGMDREEALDIVGELGLNAVVSGDGDKVESQKPEPGSPISQGKNINLIFSGGQKPDV